MTSPNKPTLLDLYKAPAPRQSRGGSKSLMDLYKPGTGLINEVEDEEEKKRRIEAEQKAWREKFIEGFGNPEKGSFREVTLDQMLGTGQDIVQAVKDPSTIVKGIGQGLHSVGQLAKGLVTDPVHTIPTAARGIIYDGIIRPLILNPLELIGRGLGVHDMDPVDADKKIRETNANFIGLALGSLAAKAAVAAKAPASLKPLLGAKNPIELMNKMDDIKLLEVANAAVETGMKQSILNSTKVVAGWGLPTALLTGDTPEERFSNAVNYGIASAVLGGMIGATKHMLGRKSMDSIQRIQQTAKDISAARTGASIVSSLPPIEAAIAATDLADAVFSKPDDAMAVVAANTKDHDMFVIRGVPKGLTPGEHLLTSDQKITRVVANKKGDAIVMGQDRSLTPEQITQFERHSIWTGALVDHGGKQYTVGKIHGVQDPRVQLIDVDTGSPVRGKVKLADISLADQQLGDTSPIRRAFEEIVPQKTFDDLGMPAFARDKIQQYLSHAETARMETVKDIVANTTSKGFRIVPEAGGQYSVFDMSGGESRHVGIFKNLDDLGQFTNGILGHVGESLLTGEGSVPFISPSDMPRGQLVEHGRLEGWLAKQALKTPYIMPSQQFFKYAQTLMRGSRIYDRFFDIHRAKREFIYSRERYGKILDVVARQMDADKVTPELKQDLFAALETMSPDDFLSDDLTRTYVLGRKMSSQTKQVGDNLATLGTPEALKDVLRIISVAHDDAIQQGIDPLANVLEFAKTNNLTPEQTKIAGWLHGVISQGFKESLDDFSVAEAIAYASSIVSKSLSKEDFIAKKGWKAGGKELKYLEQLRQFDRDIFPELIGDPKRQINQYNPRYWLEEYTPSESRNPFTAEQRALLLSENPEFQHALHRLGLNEGYVTDPIRARQVYMMRGLRKKYLREAIAEFKQEVDATAALFKAKFGEQHRPAGAKFERAANVFLEDFQNFISEDDLNSAAVTEQYLQNLGADPTRVKGLARMALNITSTAGIGFSPIQAIRDFVSFGQAYSTMLGPRAFFRALELFDSASDDLVRKIQKEGLIPNELTKFLFEDKFGTETPGVTQSSINALNSGLDKFADLGFKASLQARAYRRIHTATFLERYDTVSKAYKAFTQHKNIERFHKEIKLSIYSTPVRQQFINLINDGKVYEAAKYLGIASGFEIAGVYGYATHPIGWGGTFGRVMGQYGQWPLWAMNMMGQIASRGDTGVYARWVAANTALMATGLATGLNLSQWQLNPLSTTFFGGPWANISFAVAAASGHPDPQVRNFYQNYLRVRLNPIANPKQIYFPIPFQFWNMLSALGVYEPNENVEEILQNNPGLAIARFMGFSVTPFREAEMLKNVISPE